MKRLLRRIAAAILILALAAGSGIPWSHAVRADAGSGEVLVEDWESGTVGAAVYTNGWSTVESKGEIRVADNPSEGVNAIRISNNADVGNTNKSNVLLKNSFAPVTAGRLEITFHFLSENKKWNRLLHVNNTGNFDKFIVLTEDGGNNRITFTAGGQTGTLLSSYSANTWYTFRIVINVDAWKLDAIYVNEQLKTEGPVLLDGATRRIASIMTMAGDTMPGAAYLLDNIRIHQPEDPLVVEGPAAIIIPPEGESNYGPYTAGIEDTQGGLDPAAAIWSLPGEPQGLSVDSAGIVTAASDASPGAYLLRAAISEGRYTDYLISAAARYAVYDGFESEEGLSSSYSYSAINGSVAVEPAPGADNHAVALRNNGDVANTNKSTVNLRRYFQPVASGLLTVEFDYLTMQKTYNRIIHLNNTGAFDRYVRLDGNPSTITYNAGSTSGTLLDNYEANRWYRFRIVVDLTAQKLAGIYVDGILKAADVPFPTPVSQLQMISSHTADTMPSIAYFLDRITVDTRSDELDMDIALRDEQMLTLPSPVREDLPSTGSGGSTVLWSSSVSGLVGGSGQLLGDWDAGPVNATLTAKVQYGNTSVSKVFADATVYPAPPAIIPAVHDIGLSGPSQVLILQELPATADYTAVVSDQFGAPLADQAVIWSLATGAYTGVELDAATGQLTVDSGAAPGVLRLQAKSASSAAGSGWVTAVMEVALLRADPAVNDRQGWSLTFHDNFNNPVVDASKWNPHYHYAGSSLANYVIEDGILKLRLEPGTGSTHVTTKEFGVAGEQLGEDFTDFYQQYGLFEIRAKIYRAGAYTPGTVTGGYHSAYWMMPQNPNYAAQEGYTGFNHRVPITGIKKTYDEVFEIDNYEYTWNAVHYGQGYPPELVKGNDKLTPVLEFDPVDDFHVYTLEWTREELIFFMDGQETWRINRSAHTPFYMYLSLYEGSDWTGTPDRDPATYPKDFQIDYIKVYQFAQGTRIALKNADSSFTAMSVPDIRLYDDVFLHDGEYMLELDPYKDAYQVALPADTLTPPVIEARPYQGETQVSVTQAVYFPGAATVTVTPGDGTPAKSYTVLFVREEDKTDPVYLAVAIQNAKELIRTSQIGNSYGQIPQTAVDALELEIAAVKAVWARADVTQADLDAAEADLEEAVADYRNSERTLLAPYGAPVIDGTAELLWQEAEFLTVSKPGKGTTDVTGQVKLLWDESNLYVLGEITDSTPRDTLPSTVNPWNTDSLEILLDETNDAASFVDGVRQIRVDINGNVSGKTKNGYTREVYEVELADVEAAVVPTATGYRVEVKIPFSILEAAGNERLGLDIQINDSLTGNSQDATVYFLAGGSAAPNKWGRLRLLPE
ncbi:MAG: beta,4-xylanase [Paenibacillaceae bacterium]|nr:beta,4-xylanase [Paenibacillaceae bacterium]